MNATISDYMPELLGDMWAMGGSPEVIVELIRGEKLPVGETNVLDLGCGRGAVSIQLAREFGFRTVGIDICDSYLEFARDKAKEYKISHLCNFESYDIFEILSSNGTYDVVILASLGGILGTYKKSVEQLRQVVREGGYIIIDDGYLKGNKLLKRAGYNHYVNHHQTIDQLTGYGDKIIKEVNKDKESRLINAQYLSTLKENSIEFIKEHPHLVNALGNFIQSQENECNIINEYITKTVWLIEKGKEM